MIRGFCESVAIFLITFGVVLLLCMLDSEAAEYRLRWEAPTTHTDGTAIGEGNLRWFEVHESAAGVTNRIGAFTADSESADYSTTTTLTIDTFNVEHCYTVTAVSDINGSKSAPSAPACITLDEPTGPQIPEAPTSVTITIIVSTP